MKKVYLFIVLACLSVNTFGQDEVITVFEGIKIKNGHRDEALFYYRNNWAKMRETAIEKRFIQSFEMVWPDSPAESGFDFALVTRYLNQAQYEKSEENFRPLITGRGEPKLLNELKPGKFRKSVVVATFKGSFFAFPNIKFSGSSEKRIRLENEGWELFGDLRLPFLGHPVPAVILLNKANGSREAYEGLARRLAQEGIASLRIDLRAHGESTNKGRFGPPFDEKMRSLLTGTDSDIAAIQSWVADNPAIDSSRIGVVGASYTGEEMVAAVRKGMAAKAFVALSPGSYSETSAKSIDKSGIPWLFIKSVDEIDLMKDVFAQIRANSKTARILEVSGNKHATDILMEQPDVKDVITFWFKRNL